MESEAINKLDGLRTSLIVDPADGLALPALLPSARARTAAMPQAIVRRSGKPLALQSGACLEISALVAQWPLRR